MTSLRYAWRGVSTPPPSGSKIEALLALGMGPIELIASFIGYKQCGSCKFFRSRGSGDLCQQLDPVRMRTGVPIGDNRKTRDSNCGAIGLIYP